MSHSAFNSAADLPAWRSLLFVPVIRETFVAKAHTRGADAIILDLEDSVPETEKERARSCIAAAAASVGQNGAEVLVRINRPWQHAFRDIEAAVGPQVTALVCPKVANPQQLNVIAEMLEVSEGALQLPIGHTRLVALIESADAYFRIRDIAGATPRLVAIALGSLDFALSVGMEPIAEALQGPTQTVAIAARAVGLLPLGLMGSLADFSDSVALSAIARRSRSFGFAGAMCIHPSQVPILNDAFGVSAKEIDRAQRMIAAYEEALAKGVGAITFEGQMIDVPVIERARTIIKHGARRSEPPRV